MALSVLPDTNYMATRLTIATAIRFDVFKDRFERAVPAVLLATLGPLAAVSAIREQIAVATKAASHGFLIDHHAPVDKRMRLAGRRCIDLRPPWATDSRSWKSSMENASVLHAYH